MPNSRTLYSKTQVASELDQVFQHIEKQVFDEHGQSWPRIKGWFRNKFQIRLGSTLLHGAKSGAGLGYEVTKKTIEKSLNYTVGQVPLVGIALDVGSELWGLGEKGVGLGVKLLGELPQLWRKHQATQGIAVSRDLNDYVQGLDKDYNPKKGADRIDLCVDKLKFAHKQIEDFRTANSAGGVDCEKLTGFIHDVEWYHYRLERLRAEIFVLNQHLSSLEETASKHSKKFTGDKKLVKEFAVESLLQTHSGPCSDACLLANVRPLPLPPTPLPAHGHGRPLPPVPPKPGRPLPPVPPGN